MAQGEFAYAMNCNRFMGAPPLADQRFALVGIPFDGAVSNRPGARFGPAEIRRASLMLCDGIHPHFDVSPLGVLGDGLDMRLPNASPLAEVRRLVEAQARQLMARHHCVFLGGDHSVRWRCCAPRMPCTARWHWCISTPTATPGATISASLPGMAPGPARRCSRAW